MKTITLFIVGEIHRDPAAAVMMLNAYNRFKAAGVPFILCTEENEEQTLKISATNVTGCLKEIEILKAVPEIAAELIRDEQHKLPYFLFSQYSTVLRIINKYFPKADSVTRETWMQRIMLLNRYPVELKLFLQLLRDKAPYVAMDYPYTQKMAYLERVSNNKIRAGEDETLRMRHMANRVITAAASQLVDTGGVIFCNLGVLHTHRLAIYILQALKQQPIANCQIVPVPVLLFSPYSIDARPGMAGKITEMGYYDDADTKAWISSLNFHELIATETATGDFENAEFNKLVGFAIEAHQSSLTTITIPDLNEKKLRVLFTLGVLLQQTTGSAEVSLPLAWLLKYTRDLLDIDKCKVNFADHAQQRLTYLTGLPQVTVTGQDENSAIVTFPKTLFGHVNKATLDWEKLDAELSQEMPNQTKNNF